MTSRRRILNCWLFTLALAGFLACAQAQDVIIFLRNGDRIAGKLISENTNQVVVSTVWIKELAIPVTQIARRETLPAGTLSDTNAPASTTVLKSPTNVVTIVRTPTATVVVSNAVPVTTNWFRRHFKGEVAIGTTYMRGATDSELYYGKA